MGGVFLRRIDLADGCRGTKLFRSRLVLEERSGGGSRNRHCDRRFRTSEQSRLSSSVTPQSTGGGGGGAVRAERLQSAHQSTSQFGSDSSCF